MNTLGRSRDTFGYPASRSGKISVGLIALALSSAGFIAAAQLLIGGMFLDQAILHAGWVTAPMAALALCGVLSSIAAMVSVVVERERSVFVAIAFFVGLVIIHVSINGL